jgi:diacylglycerol O-acyltransferase
MLQQLGVTDANFLYMETAETPMHIGSLYLYELPPGYTGDFYDDFKAQIASRMHLFPVLTRKLAQMPFDIDAPLWVRDDVVDLDYHLRRHTVPKPGRFDQLEELVGRLHSNFLDRSRPLWEIYIIDGLADGRVAEYAKFHHAGFDGAAAMAFVQSLYDLTPVPRSIPPPRHSQDEKETLDPVKLMGLVYANAVRQYLRAMQAIPDFLKAWAKLALPDPQTLTLQPPALPQLAPWTRLNASITSQRSYAARTVPLKDIKQIAKAHGSTVNDVLLAICSGALRRYLREKKDLPAEALTAFVPISLREAGNAEMNNQVFGMICSLATDVVDPLKRLLAIHDSAQNAKRLTDTIKAAALNLFSPWGAPFLVHGLMDMLGHYHLADRARPLANLTISNNVGPPAPLYLAGARVAAMYPMSIPTHGSALNITVQGYCDDLDIGLIACRHAVPDVSKLGDYVVDAFKELKSAALKKASASPEKPARTTGGGRKRGSAAARTARTKVPATKPASIREPKQPRLVSARNEPTNRKAQRGASNTLHGAAAANALRQPAATTPSSARSSGNTTEAHKSGKQ